MPAESEGSALCGEGMTDPYEFMLEDPYEGDEDEWSDASEDVWEEILCKDPCCVCNLVANAPGEHEWESLKAECREEVVEDELLNTKPGNGGESSTDEPPDLCSVSSSQTSESSTETSDDEPPDPRKGVFLIHTVTPV